MRIVSFFIVLLLPVVLAAQPHDHRPAAPYAGQQTRAIKSLSADDVAELRRGGGWGLAKAAELNGYPGPAHVLENADALGLTDAQRTAIRAIFAKMQQDAVAEGARLLALEEALEADFANRTVTPESLERQVAAIVGSLGRLRRIHLAAHLTTPAELTPEQVARYNALRGYVTDPCSSVPPGHDAAMWRRHNGCR
jgi:Spy/CpxP family protein refolding chaperone